MKSRRPRSGRGTQQQHTRPSNSTLPACQLRRWFLCMQEAAAQADAGHNPDTLLDWGYAAHSDLVETTTPHAASVTCVQPPTRPRVMRMGPTTLLKNQSTGSNVELCQPASPRWCWRGTDFTSGCPSIAAPTIMSQRIWHRSHRGLPPLPVGAQQCSPQPPPPQEHCQ